MTGENSIITISYLRSYILLQDRVIDGELMGRVDDMVFECIRDDHGCANQDTRATGIPHIAVTFDPKGGYPFFTVPRRDLKDFV